jgi:hypothetical protein
MTNTISAKIFLFLTTNFIIHIISSRIPPPMNQFASQESFSTASVLLHFDWMMSIGCSLAEELVKTKTSIAIADCMVGI